jgi:putative colanic acid biosynthesis glycosyltransferase
VRLLQINTTVGTGSTGRIAEDIGRVAKLHGIESSIAFGRGNPESNSNLIRIGDKVDMWAHGLQTLIFDRHGFASKNATFRFIEQVKKVNPDVIHLHNIHGYYLHIGVLGKYLQESECPVIWTFHDSWAFTGHCTYFDNINCQRWKTGCFACPKTRKYPASILLDNSKQNYIDKKEIFGGLSNLHIVTPSHWLAEIVKLSFLGQKKIQVIPNGIDTSVFNIRENTHELKLRYGIADKKILLGVASIWDPRKGLEDFLALSKQISNDLVIVLIGLTLKQQKELPVNIIGIERTENIAELASWYSAASVFVNPTWQDNFPTTNIEALACGTPVITYRTGGSPEAIDKQTGKVVEKGDINGLLNGISELIEVSGADISTICRERALSLFDKNIRYNDYINLYRSVLK